MKAELNIGTEGPAIPSVMLTAESTVERNALGRLVIAIHQNGRELVPVFVDENRQGMGVDILAIGPKRQPRLDNPELMVVVGRKDWRWWKEQKSSRVYRAFAKFEAPLAGQRLTDCLRELADAVAETASL